MIKIDINKGIDINISIAMETTTNILGTLDGFKVFHGEKVNNLIEGYLLSLKRVDNHKGKEEVIEEKVDTPEEKVDTPEEKEEPEEKVDTPEEKVDTPEEKVDTPEEKVDTPEEKVDTPEEKVDTPEEKVTEDIG